MVNFTCSITLTDKDYRDYSEYAEEHKKTVPDLVRDAVKDDVKAKCGKKKEERGSENVTKEGMT
jgi:hypothetical protein